MNKENFAKYLEETAHEIRALSLTPAYLEDMCQSLIKLTNQFWKEAEENARLRVIE